ncbi:MAG: hypothetical protein EOP84_04350 [Verrucomicrobiaceae bacterium]|nr:MAG: hypothetical protein EOP84_04350 [Verrucomicrobiaceae bacterium]
MRDYGFWLVLLPLVWALAATLSIRSVDVSPSTESFYLLAGSILLAALCIVFVASAFVAFHAATYSGVTSFQ